MLQLERKSYACSLHLELWMCVAARVMDVCCSEKESWICVGERFMAVCCSVGESWMCVRMRESHGYVLEREL